MNKIKILLCFIFLIYASQNIVVFSKEANVSTASETGDTFDENDDFDDFDDFDDEFNGKDLQQSFDPFMVYNRCMFQINDKLYHIILKPMAVIYNKIIPTPVRFSIQKFFNNITFPARLINNLLQGKFKNASIECGRFLINSTIGILGFFDPAKSKFHLLAKKEDFGQTLGYYGIKEGIPLVLPFYGFSNLRDALGRIPDYLLNPVSFVRPEMRRMLIIAGDKMNYISLNSKEYDNLKSDALDEYTFLKYLYQKDRRNKIEE